MGSRPPSRSGRERSTRSCSAPSPARTRSPRTWLCSGRYRVPREGGPDDRAPPRPPPPAPDPTELTTEALRRDSVLSRAPTSLGLALSGLGGLDPAVEEPRRALRRQPDALTARLTLATALVAKQDWAAARVELEHVLSAQPDLGQAHYSLGVVRYARGDLDGAIEAFRRVLVGDPHHQDARYNLALMLRLAQRDAEATPEFLVAAQAGHARAQYFTRSEERRVGEECRSRWSPYH